MVSVGDDSTVRLWYADGTGQPLTLRGHDRLSVRVASFTPDGTRVVTAGSDGTVRLWRADGTGEPVILPRHDRPVYAASLSLDRTQLASIGGDRTLKLWRVFTSEHALIEAARASLPRQLTDAQRAKYHLPPR